MFFPVSLYSLAHLFSSRVMHDHFLGNRRGRSTANALTTSSGAVTVAYTDLSLSLWCTVELPIIISSSRDAIRRLSDGMEVPSLSSSVHTCLPYSHVSLPSMSSVSFADDVMAFLDTLIAAAGVMLNALLGAAIVARYRLVERV